ncbi:exodeoxyribonuclease I [Limibaculum sp. M0105]|uniref:Exodeoxyribonuclease I n=1 Tax=Thermohalobaculum xanthum TaxID=2753746 RepID=A0A8J7MAH0_9RHOB|nr:exonuclease domain-containing protein [Thermohalobaculum xanthum]MBK0401213.1 exodeoxyribonuclease I [Thermohalobaculum xanthum]
MFAVYDLETSGISPAFDQPLQFAAILTDDELNPVERVNIRCRLAPHILPSPMALVVTGVTPETLTDPSLPSWFEFTRLIRDLILRWSPATWTGFNTLNFDEEFLRQSFYQNLCPNLYETQFNGNDRLDIMRLAWAVWTEAPEALEWPVDDLGRILFRLDRLAPLNGFTAHNAHDALGDVEATIFLARLIRDRAPCVWEAGLRNRNKHTVNDLLATGRPLRLVDRFGSAPPRAFTGCYCGRNANNPNSVGFLDLDLADPAELIAADDSALDAAVGAMPKVIRSFAVNKLPLLFEVDGPEGEAHRRARLVAERPDFHERVGAALARRSASWESEASEHPEENIYGGFYTRADQALLERFHEASWDERLHILSQLSDTRLVQLGRRLAMIENPEAFSERIEEVAETILARLTRPVEERPKWTTFPQAELEIEEIEARRILDAAGLEALRSFYTARQHALMQGELP